MRRSFLTTFLAAGALAVAGCADTPEAPVAPKEVIRPNLTVVSGATLRAQIDALLTGTARTAAHLQLYRVEQDIRYRRPWLYLDALALAAIPLHERERHGIPPEKLEKLFQFLCAISDFIKPYLPVWLQAIDFCMINPGQVTTDAKIQIVPNATGGTVTTTRQTFSFDIEPGSMFDAAGNPVSFVLVVVLPLVRQGPIPEVEPHPCPLPWDDESFPQSRVDCYEEFYDLTVTPRVRFDPAADLEICQLDPGAEGNPNAPSSTVLARLELFTKDADNVVRILPNPDEVSDANAICIEDNIEHAIGPIDWSRTGMRNAFARLERFGSRAFRLFRPTTLYADNVPTHGDIFDQLLFGNVVGAIDRRTRSSSIVRPSSAGLSQEGENPTVTLPIVVASGLSMQDNTGIQLELSPDPDEVVTWSSSDPLGTTASVNTTGLLAVVQGNDAPALANEVVITAESPSTSGSIKVNSFAFDHFPRITTLVWRPVDGAAMYDVEIEFGNDCTAGTAICSLWTTEGSSTTVEGVGFVFEFVGSQPGRWRVVARDAAGAPISTSEWVYFRYVI